MPEIRCQLTKADFEGRFEGIATRLVPDSAGEIINWRGTKEAFAEFAAQNYRASRGKSYGAVRLQHSSDKPIGILTAPPVVDEARKEIRVQGQVFSDESRRMLESGTLHSLSLGGAYKDKRKLANGLVEFTPVITEVSLCDTGAVPGAVLTWTAANHVTLRKAFQPTLEKWKRRDVGHLLLAEVARQLRKAGGVCFAPGHQSPTRICGHRNCPARAHATRENPNQKFTRTRGLL